jgi:peptide methionine sulfoxide reductase MsrA
MGDHTETVQVDYDPERITYGQLLEIFWEIHDPTSRNLSRQYMNVVFYHDDEQRNLAIASKDAMEQKTSGIVRTKVLPIKSFTIAEDYHQKYILKRKVELKNEMVRIYPRHSDFVASTAATRLNGYADGNGTRGQLLRELEYLGLSKNGKDALLRLVR